VAATQRYVRGSQHEITLIGSALMPLPHAQVDLDPRYVNHEQLHLLDLTDQEKTPITVINADQTYSADWLSLSDVNDTACDGFPTPYDNDYRGADQSNPNDVPSRFDPDKPVFAQLPDGSYAIHDTRMLLHENTLENPLMDGAGPTVLRSSLRSQRNGIVTSRSTIGPGLFSDTFYVHNDRNIALCVNEQPNLFNFEHCKVSYEENVCVKEYKDARDTLTDVQVRVLF